MSSLSCEIILEQPHLGWVVNPTPVTPLRQLATQQNSKWIGCKRDDLCTHLFGGTKVRKLDFLLAASPWKESEWLSTVGAIGSGHVVACCAAAKAQNKKIVAHLFWEPLSSGIIENLAYIASTAQKIYFYQNRVNMALRNPELFFQPTHRNCSIIPPGATNAEGMLGTVRAGLELAQQIQSGEIPHPKRIYVSLGTGGTAAGLSIGLAMAQINTSIHAITTVEPLLSTRYRMNNLISGTQKLIAKLGNNNTQKIKPLPLYINRNFVGKGYGYPSAQSLKAMEIMKINEIDLEPVYTGKTAAAMLHDIKNGFNDNVLFWNSRRRSLPEIKTDWKQKLPEKLLEKLNEQTRDN